MTIREIRFDGFSPVAVLDNGTFDTFDARRFDAVVSDARNGVIDLDNTFIIELEELDDDYDLRIDDDIADVDDDALALADDDFDDDYDLRIDFNGWTSTVYVGY